MRTRTILVRHSRTGTSAGARLLSSPRDPSPEFIRRIPDRSRWKSCKDLINDLLRVQLAGSLVLLITAPVVAQGSDIRHDAAISQPRLVVQLVHSDGIKTVAFSPDGHSVMTGSWDDSAELWDAQTGRQLRVFEADSGDGIAFSPDGRRLLTGATLWDAETGRQHRIFEAIPGKLPA